MIRADIMKYNVPEFCALCKGRSNPIQLFTGLVDSVGLAVVCLICLISYLPLPIYFYMEYETQESEAAYTKHLNLY